MQTPTHTQKVERIWKVGCSRIFLFKWFFSFQKKIFYLQPLWAELRCLTDLKHFSLSHVTLYIAFLRYGALSHGSRTFRALFLKRAVSPVMDTTILWWGSMVLSRRHALELQRGYPTSRAPAPGEDQFPHPGIHHPRHGNTVSCRVTWSTVSSHFSMTMLCLN